MNRYTFLFFMISFLYLLSFFFVQDPETSLALQSPSWSFVFGTDDLGRSFFWILSRAIGNSMVLSALSLSIALLFSCATILLVKSHKKNSEGALFSVIQVLDTIPGFIWISVIMTLVGKDLPDGSLFILLSILMGLNYYPKTYRSMRGYLKSIYNLGYIEGGRAIGLSEKQILVRYIVPELFYLIYPVLVQTGISLLLAEGYLSFLGLGLRSTSFTLGSILNRGWYYLIHSPHLFWIPSLFLMLLIFLIRTKLRASLSGGPLKAQETDQ